MIPDRILQWSSENNCTEPFYDETSSRWFAFPLHSVMPIQYESKLAQMVREHGALGAIIAIDAGCAEGSSSVIMEAEIVRVVAPLAAIVNQAFQRFNDALVELFANYQTPTLLQLDQNLRSAGYVCRSPMPPQFVQEDDATFNRRQREMRLMLLSHDKGDQQ